MPNEPLHAQQEPVPVPDLGTIFDVDENLTPEYVNAVERFPSTLGTQIDEEINTGYIVEAILSDPPLLHCAYSEIRRVTFRSDTAQVTYCCTYIGTISFQLESGQWVVLVCDILQYTSTVHPPHRFYATEIEFVRRTSRFEPTCRLRAPTPRITSIAVTFPSRNRHLCQHSNPARCRREGH